MYLGFLRLLLILTPLLSENVQFSGSVTLGTRDETATFLRHWSIDSHTTFSTCIATQRHY